MFISNAYSNLIDESKARNVPARKNYIHKFSVALQFNRTRNTCNIAKSNDPQQNRNCPELPHKMLTKNQEYDK